MIHAYKMNGYNIILDQNSGCVHSVDEVAYDIITAFETRSKAEIKADILAKYGDREDVTAADIEDCFADIEALIADGRLFAEDSFESTAAAFKKRQGVLKAICLHVAHASCGPSGERDAAGANTGIVPFDRVFLGWSNCQCRDCAEQDQTHHTSGKFRFHFLLPRFILIR